MGSYFCPCFGILSMFNQDWWPGWLMLFSLHTLEPLQEQGVGLLLSCVSFEPHFERIKSLTYMQLTPHSTHKFLVESTSLGPMFVIEWLLSRPSAQLFRFTCLKRQTWRETELNFLFYFISSYKNAPANTCFSWGFSIYVVESVLKRQAGVLLSRLNVVYFGVLCPFSCNIHRDFLKPCSIIIPWLSCLFYNACCVYSVKYHFYLLWDIFLRISPLFHHCRQWFLTCVSQPLWGSNDPPRDHISAMLCIRYSYCGS